LTNRPEKHFIPNKENLGRAPPPEFLKKNSDAGALQVPLGIWGRTTSLINFNWGLVAPFFVT